MKQRIQEQTVTRKNGGSTVVTISSAIKQVSGINTGATVTVTAEAGKIVIVKEE